jgi:hypothetical protein
MRVWDLPPRRLCRQHLLGEHRELHAIWTVITKYRRGYRQHPETKRWVGKLRALFNRHEQLVQEMERRNYHHLSPLDKRLATGSARQTVYIDTPKKQVRLLKDKPCDCPYR